MPSFFDTIFGDTAIIVGGGEALSNIVSRNFRQVIAADPSRMLSSGLSKRLLREGEIQYVTGNEAQPEKLNTKCDCIILAFALSRTDDPIRVIQPWIEQLNDRGQIVIIEWAHSTDPTDSNLQVHAELLTKLEKSGRLVRMGSRQLTRWLQSAGLSHVRQLREDSSSIFSNHDRAMISTEGIAELVKLGEEDSPLVKQLRSGISDLLPVSIAHGTHKALVQTGELSIGQIDQDGHNINSEKPPSISILKEKSVSEILATVLKEFEKDSEEAAKQLLESFGAKALSSVQDSKLLADMIGIDQSTAKHLTYVLELGRRLYSEDRAEISEIHGPEDAYNLLSPQMSTLTREHFRGLYLNVKGGVIADEVISIGTLTASLVHPREVYGPAIESHCHSILIAHNHPSGDPNPSPEDIHITRELAEAGRLLGIILTDHIIIGRDSYVSMRERGHL
jgi:DNA repair protein RadC